ncbi:MAG TPA: hypothetical protein VLD37_05605 [Candidatus Bilamarchaeum sp.]|nr:hypothetical protein [Candidatus Bilamarchaeum sp.]
MTEIPPRSTDPDNPAMSGAQIMARLREILGDTQSGSAQDMEARRARAEEFIYQQVISGNVPDFMRPQNWPEMSVEAELPGGRTLTARVRVCPDYLAIGGNADFVRVPINPLTAQRIADRFGFVLPTQRQVDLIDAQARSAGGMVAFAAAPSIAKRVTDPKSRQSVEKKWNYQQYGYYEGRWMLSAEFIGMQNTIYSEQPEAVRTARIRSGHKKDIIYDELANHESHEGGPPVVIYRKGVQGLSNWHNEKYWDYSHGARFLSSDVRITVREKDGTTHDESLSMERVLRHKDYHRVYTPAPLDIRDMYRGTRRAVPRKTGQLAEPPVPEAPATRRRENPPQAVG